MLMTSMLPLNKSQIFHNNFFKLLIDLECSPALKKSDDYCDNCNNKKYMHNAAGTIGKKTDCPGNNQNYCHDVK